MGQAEDPIAAPAVARKAGGSAVSSWRVIASGGTPRGDPEKSPEEPALF